MSANRLFLIAGVLAVAAAVSLVSGITLLNRDIATYIGEHYREESHDVDAKRYLCSGSPKQVADTLTKYKTPAARATHGENEYMRYRRNIVIVGPEGTHPCIIRVQSLNAGYNHGAFIFLGPGFTPGTPSGGSGGPGGIK